MSENDNGTTNARTMNTLAILQGKILEDAAKDREKFLKGLSRALEDLTRSIINKDNAQDIYDFLKAYNSNAATFMQNQASVVDNLVEVFTVAVNRMGLIDACLKDFDTIANALKDDDGDGQPFPGILSTLIDKAEGFGVINAETGEITKLSKDEFMRKIGGQKE